MKLPKFFALSMIFIVAFFLTLDLFWHQGRSITFDGHIHMTAIAQFEQALNDGEFPVVWTDHYANYGYPLGLIVQQTPIYLGAWLQFATHSAVLSYNLVMLIAVFLSAYLSFRFYRCHYSELSALAAAILFNFAPYRLTNVYTRGAVAEVLSMAFIALILLGLNQILKQKRQIGFISVALGVALLGLTHPLILLLSSLIIVPYAIYLLWPIQKHWRNLPLIVLSGLVGLLMASYYLLPLKLELKYFYYGQNSQKLEVGSFANLTELLIDQNAYFGPHHPGPKKEVLSLGLLESLIVCLGLVVWLRDKNKKSHAEVWVWLISGALVLFLMTKLSLPLYRSLPLLNSIQYPWRNLTILMLVPPAMLAYLLDRLIKFKPKIAQSIVLSLVVIILSLRLPQAYGKNFMVYDLRHFDFTAYNLHTTNLNTIWSGPSADYPVKDLKPEIINGQGKVEIKTSRNAYREYLISAQTDLRLVDYTFYFPGWKVLIDGQEAPIEFQDPNYRGVITYQVPKGDHQVVIKFTDTKVRLLSKILSLLGLAGFLELMFLVYKASINIKE